MPPFPFPFLPTSEPLIRQPPVTIEFSGQMLLHPGLADTAARRTCEIAVNRFAPGHTLHATLIVKAPNQAAELVPLFAGPLTDDFLIQLKQGDVPVHPNFTVCAPTPDPFVRSPSEPNFEFDYRWALNLRHPQVHPNAVRGRGAEPIVKLNTGILYSPRLTRNGLNPTLLRDLPAGGTEVIPLYQIAPELAVSIVPPANTKVSLEWRYLGDEIKESLPRATDPTGTMYTVSFVNDPPFGSPDHEELSLYYRVLEDGGNPIPGPRWRLEYSGAISTDLIPCSPGVLNP